MDQIKHTGLISGFNNLKQLEMAVAAAQKMTGSATMSMDPEAIQNAEKALNDAKALYQTAGDTGLDQSYLNNQNELLLQCEHQLNEAKT